MRTPTLLAAIAVAALSAALLPDRVVSSAEPATKPATAPASQPSTRRTGPLAQRDPVAHPLPVPRPLAELQKLQIYQMHEPEVAIYLAHLHKAEPDPIARMVHLARKNIGQPYDIYLLGEGPFELYDPDPLYCLTHGDCVTFTEHTLAFAMSNDWPSFMRNLLRLRYKDGKVGMLTRNHETCADWNRNNGWLLIDVTATLGQGKAAQPFNVLWKPSRFFARWNIGQDMPDVKFVDSYIPRDAIEGILGDLQAGDVIQIVRGAQDPRWVGHLGLCTIGPKGERNFLHSAEPAVREQTLLSYVQGGKSTVGIKVLRPKVDVMKNPPK